MKYTTVIFDLDGTLLDTLEDLMNAVNHVLAAHNYPIRTYDQIRRAVGNGVALLMERSTPDGLSPDEQALLLDEFKAWYKNHLQDTTKPYDGIFPLLSELKSKGYRLAIVSNKLHGAVQKLNRQYFDEYIPIAVGESEHILRKPSPDMVFEALRLLGSEASEAVYIGDSEVDFETATNAKMDCISVTWGFRDEEDLRAVGSTTFARKPSDILNLL